VNELSADQRRSLESLLGSPLELDQHVMVLAYTPGVLAAEMIRQAARNRIERTLLINHEVAAEQGVSAEEADEAIFEALRHVRRGS
jgi:hypothetical protein